MNYTEPPIEQALIDHFGPDYAEELHSESLRHSRRPWNRLRRYIFRRFFGL